MIDLFTEDAEMWFPKHGVAKGKAGIGRFARILGASPEGLTHAIDEFSDCIESHRRTAI